MKKLLCFVLLLVLVSSAFSGCNGRIGQTTITTITKYEGEEVDVSASHSESTAEQSNPSSKKPSVSSKKPANSSSKNDKKTSSKNTSSKNTSSKNISSSPVSSETSSTPVPSFENEVIQLPDDYSSSPSSAVSSSFEDLDNAPSELPCYSTLNETQKVTYQVISRMVKRHTDGFCEVPSKTTADIAIAYSAVSSDHPEYFWMPHQYVIAKGDGKYHVAMKYSSEEYNFNYLYDASQVKHMQVEISLVVEKIKKLVTETSTIGKEKILHDWLCDNIYYSPHLEKESIFNIYGALVEGYAVCEGYSRAMQYLCGIYNIDCILVTGYSSGVGHMWNQIKIEDEWYNLDVTWDDPDSSSTPIWYSYFNLNDTTMEIDHVFDPLSKNLNTTDIDNGETFNILRMKCDSMVANYGTMNDRIITTDEADADFVIKSAFIAAGAEDLEYIDFFFSHDIPLKRYFVEQIYELYKMDEALFSNNQSALIGGRVLLTLRSYAKKGQCYRVYFK